MEIGSQEWLQAKSTGPHWQWTDSTGMVRQGYMQQFSDRGGTDVTYYMRRYDGTLDLVSGSRAKSMQRIK